MDDFSILDMKTQVWTRLCGKYGLPDPTAIHTLTAVSASRLVAVGGKRVGDGAAFAAAAAEKAAKGGGGGEGEDEDEDEDDDKKKRRRKKKEKIKYISNKVFIFNVVSSSWSEDPEALPLVDFASAGGLGGGIMGHEALLVEKKKYKSVICFGGYEDERHHRPPEYLVRFDVPK